MNRLTDLLVSFGLALFLHGVLALGAVWVWTLRPSELRPVFQGGDVSLAVTFVAAGDGGQTADDGRQTTEESGQTTDPPTPRRYGGQVPDDGKSEIENQAPDTAEILTDPEAEMPEDEIQTTDDRRRTTEEAGEDQDMLDAETAASVSAQASAHAPDDGLPADLSAEALAKGEAPGAKAGRQPALRSPALPDEAGIKDSAADAADDALRQGVSGAVRRKSEIRPYYPLGARLRGEEGAVTVRVWVNGSGRARRCEVARSSGYPALDQSAVDAARRARYVSTRPGAWRAETETTLTFRFKLTE